MTIYSGLFLLLFLTHLRLGLYQMVLLLLNATFVNFSISETWAGITLDTKE